MIQHSALHSIRLLAIDVDGILTDGRLWHSFNGTNKRHFSVRDRMSLRHLKRAGLQVAMFASFHDPEVEVSFREAGIDYYFGNCFNKSLTFDALLLQSGLPHEQTAFVSRDSHDLLLMQKVGFSATVADAALEVRQAVNYISACEGGDGAVRDIAQLFLLNSVEPTQKTSKMTSTKKAVSL